MPRIPSDQCSPYGTARQPSAAIRPPRPRARPGVRVIAAPATTTTMPSLRTKLAARRSGLMQSGLPVFYRFGDLVAAGLVVNRTSLRRLVDEQNFPPGVMVGDNTRVWRVTDIEAWLATRSTARKVTPPGARNPRAKRRAAEAQP